MGCRARFRREHLIIRVQGSPGAVTTPEDAELWGFRGSPSVLVDGEDPFACPDAPVGLSCRLYRPPEGDGGSPTREQLVDVLSRT